MTLPETPPPPDTVGTQPRNATEINGLVGTHLRDFLVSKARIGQDFQGQPFHVTSPRFG